VLLFEGILTVNFFSLVFEEVLQKKKELKIILLTPINNENTSYIIQIICL
jgi:hypothetical protein